MTTKLVLELTPAALERLEAMRRKLNEKSPEDVAYRALGLLHTIIEGGYLDSESVLTLVDPTLAEQDDADPYVDLQLGNPPKGGHIAAH